MGLDTLVYRLISIVASMGNMIREITPGVVDENTKHNSLKVVFPGV